MNQIAEWTNDVVTIRVDYSELTKRHILTILVPNWAVRSGEVPALHSKWWQGVNRAIIAKMFQNGRWPVDVTPWQAPDDVDGDWHYTISGKLKSRVDPSNLRDQFASQTA